MASGLHLRRAEPGDEMAVAAVHVGSWQAAYVGLMPARFLDGLRAEDRAARYTFAERESGRPETVLAVEAGQIVGFATVGPARGASSSACGELYALYVRPHRWGRGAGRALMVDARERLARAGFTEAVLWVLDGNKRARRFYGIDGWRHDGSRRREEVHGVQVDEVGYRRSLA